MNVAFASSTGVLVDSNFLKTDSYTIWSITPTEANYVTTVWASPHGHADVRIAARADTLKGCHIVFAREINAAAAAKLVARNVHPMRLGNNVAVEEIITELQEVMRNNPPPWIRKMMAAGAIAQGEVGKSASTGVQLSAVPG